MSFLFKFTKKTVLEQFKGRKSFWIWETSENHLGVLHNDLDRANATLECFEKERTHWSTEQLTQKGSAKENNTN